MAIALSRRQILKLLGGSISGILFTPIPWKLLDDTAIWTQTGPWIAKLPRGPVSFSFSTCSLCPAGCGMKARCVAGVPVSLSALEGHPLSGGTLCPVGIGAHQLRYHPLRITTPVRIQQENEEVQQLTADEAATLLNKALRQSRGSVGLLDLRPGRTASLQYRILMGGLPNGSYLVSPSDDHALFYGLEVAFRMPEGTMSVDLDSASTILSFGVPLAETWDGPGRALGMMQRGRQNVIQVEARRSRTAALSNRWIRIRPGTEALLALGLASVLIDENLHDRASVSRIADFAGPRGSSYIDFVRGFNPAEVESITGVPREAITALARELAATSPAVVISSTDAGGGGRTDAEERAIWGLNVLLGSLNRGDTVGMHHKVPLPPRFATTHLVKPTNFSAVSDHSLDVLIIDQSQAVSALPWGFVRRKLSASAQVFCFSPTLSGLAAMSDIVFPAPAPLECVTDVSSHPGASSAAYAVSSPVGQPSLLPDPVTVLSSLFGSAVTSEELVRERVAAIHASQRGKVFSPQGSWRTLREIADPGELWKRLQEGGVWIEEGIERISIRKFQFMGPEPDQFRVLVKAGKKNSTKASLTLLFTGRRNAIDHAQLSPVMTKLCQESGLWQTAQMASVHPEDAREASVEEGDHAVLTTSNGTLDVVVHLDAAVMRGVVEIAVGPSPIAIEGSSLTIAEGPLRLANVNGDGTWRTTSVALAKGSVS